MKTKSKFNPVTSREVRRTNAQRANLREYANQTFQATGTAYFDRDSNTFGFQDLTVWNPRKQRIEILTKNDSDRFLVTAESIDLAISEFWSRWKLFVQRAYGLEYLRIERTNN